MKKAIDYLCWGFVAITIVVMTLTVISTYQYIYIAYFNNYYMVEVFLAITMLLWSIKFLTWGELPKRKLYSFFCFFVASAAIFFRVSQVF
ncbi:hypothetical protein [Clostridium algidicarnis]|uniref:Uncharacterized protein n=2 Tax=Clostridium algidicarnis TaxID=37659 RepID=A0A2S6FUT3_9CLOT|nr:hypothetical protein [Clostridium algidicarnis]MBB6631670.1 hypothetical protein [Clostridium algidicarnis]MBB6698499.1 hypothetical protein [Clostridium algidicarnis]MBU3194423.1 hypothetical protein [Clostridium algidicarnis]MBU3204562.1 hypothetical protein [Clostridium algidicarnis]MBU3207916.1 hypothetical protein [Clostridium algidicarnis]